MMQRVRTFTLTPRLHAPNSMFIFCVWVQAVHASSKCVNFSSIRLHKPVAVHSPDCDGHALTAGKPRGYAFIEYEHKNNMKEAYKRADGKKVEGRRVVVDVERGRTVPNWSVFLTFIPPTSRIPR